jgi:hypothetical protein
MAPTLRDGDAVLARRGGRSPRAGDVVLARFRARPDLLVVKRIARSAVDGWWIEGDNEYATDDSRVYGPADVVARVICQWWPRLRRL